MPIRAARSIVKKLSFYYYDYGNIVTSRSYLLLTVSLMFVSYFSFPVVTKSIQAFGQPTTYPLAQVSTSLDAQCWHASSHVEFKNFSLSSNAPTTFLIAEQIRLSQPSGDLFTLVQHAKSIYESITTTVLQGIEPLSLSSICYKHKGHCLVHAPPFHEWKNKHEWLLKTNTNNHTEYETHPYSIYANITLNKQGKLEKADAALLTFILNQTHHGDTMHIWNRILHQVKLKHQILDIQQQGESNIWSTSSNILPYMIQYNFNLFPFDISTKVQFSIIAYVITFYTISVLLGKTNRVKSGYSFGLAAVFLSIACFTTTWGILNKLGISFDSVPWYLLLLVINIGCLENIFLISNAVLNAGSDMTVKEKISKGLQNIGVPMTATIIAELLILKVGAYMDSELIKEFCTFIQVAITVEFFLNATFILAVLSIDVKRLELVDLDDRQISNRFDHENKGDDEQKQDSKLGAESKEFKTHRIFNAFMLCSMLLLLSFVRTPPQENVIHPLIYPPPHDLNHISDQFWSTINPHKAMTWLQIQPAQLFVFDSTRSRALAHLDTIQQLYQLKFQAIRYTLNHRPSLFRLWILSSLQKICFLLLKINVPALILCLVMLAIITWMTPKWRKQWLVPLLIHCFNQFFLTVFKYFPVKRWYTMYIKQHHVVPVTSRHHVNTLMHHHVSDISSIDTCEGRLVSCGHDGRVVSWNPPTRLDVLQVTRKGHLQAAKQKKNLVTIKKQPRMIRVNPRWVVTVYDDAIRVWNRENVLVHELQIRGYVLAVQFLEDACLITTHTTGLMHEWDVAAGTCVQTVQMGKPVARLLVDAARLFAAARDGSVQCYCRRQDRTWVLAYTIQQNTAVTSMAAASPMFGMGVLVTGSSDGVVKVWQLGTGELMCTLSSSVNTDDASDEEAEDVKGRTFVIGVAVTTYCKMDHSGLGCRGNNCDSFLVACSMSDQKVYAWRLDRPRDTCLQCRYQRSPFSSNDESDMVYKTTVVRRRHQHTFDEDAWLQLTSTFLGRIEQPGGRGIVFCDKVLAGVRKREGVWEAWFATLPHHERQRKKIPVETLELSTDSSTHEEEEARRSHQLLKNTLMHLFTGTHKEEPLEYKAIHALKSIRRHSHQSDEEDEVFEDDPDASEILPFSVIRHIVPLDGSGFACDFGNFIKVVYYKKRTMEPNEYADILEEICQCSDETKKRTVIDKKRKNITRLK